MAKSLHKTMIAGLLGAVIALGAAGSLRSEELLVLDLGSVARTAAARSLEIKAARQDVESAKGKLKEAQAYNRGKAEVKASYYRFDGPLTTRTPPMPLPEELAALLGALAAINGIPIPGGISSISVAPVKVAPKDPLHLTVQGGYPIFTSGKLSYAQKHAEYGIEAFSYISDDAEDAAVFNSTALYLGTLLAKEALAVNKEALESYNQHLEQAEKLYKSGVVAEYDLIRAQAAVKEQQSKVISAESIYQISFSALCTALALDKTQSVQLTGTLFEIPEIENKEALESEAIRNSKVIKALEAKGGALDMAGKFEKASGKPQVNAVASAELLTGKMAQTDPKWLIGLQASMDIFDGGVSASKVEQQNSEKAKVDLQINSAKDQISLGVKSSILEMDSALSSLKASRAAEKLAQESLRLATKRFEVGAGTSLEALDANVSLSAAKVSVLQSLYQLDRAYLQLHRYLGSISQICQEVQR